MTKKNLIRFIQSYVILPLMTMPMMFGGISGIGIAGNALAQKFNIEDSIALASNQLEQPSPLQRVRAQAIDTYFAEHDMPLEGMGMTMVLEAEKNDLDWRLLPAIAVRESTGGKHDCNKVDNNAFGWGSCKIGFKSNEQAIETVARNLGGNNPKTAHHYDNKTTTQILRAYNPPSIVPKYAQQVVGIMNAIGSENLAENLETTPKANA